MTRAICPACRAPITLDAVFCARCGLAVRPTCANCGEALGAADTACARCREPVESAASPVATGRMRRLAGPVPVTVAEQPAPAPTRRTRRGVVTQLVLIAVVAGVLVAGGLLALEVFTPRPAAPVDLIHRSFPSLGFSVSRPPDWKEVSRRVGGNPGVVFSPGPSRGFSVSSVPTTLARARVAVAREMRNPPANKRPIGVTDDVAVDSRDAFLYTLVQDAQYRQQWWVERPGGVFRIEFWAPEYNQRDAGELAQHIVDSFTLG